MLKKLINHFFPKPPLEQLYAVAERLNNAIDTVQERNRVNKALELEKSIAIGLSNTRLEMMDILNRITWKGMNNG